MTTEEKQQFRINILRELYDFNEEHNGRTCTINYANVEPEEAKNKNLALEYLSDKGLIYYKIKTRTMYDAKINAYGIDYIESL